jgi:hypothetical protein
MNDRFMIWFFKQIRFGYPEQISILQEYEIIG